MTDRLNTYIPSFIFCAVVEFVGAAILLILVCDKKQPRNRAAPEGTTKDDEHCNLNDTKI